MSGDELDEVIDEFLTESQENLDALDQGLVELEQNPDKDMIARIFRTIHTIKGTSGFLGFTTLESVTHVGENLLSKLRDGDLQVTQDITTGLLAMVDAVREILDRVTATHTEGDVTYPDLVERLGRLNRGEAAAPVQAPAPVVAPFVEPSATRDEVATPDETDGAAAAESADVVSLGAPPKSTKRSRAATPVEAGRTTTTRAKRPRNATVTALPVADAAPVPDPVDELVVTEAGMFGRILLDDGKLTTDDLSNALHRQDDGDPRTVGELLVEEQVITPKDVVETLKTQSEDRPAAAETIRVDVRLLDDLMNLVGELVLARNQILQFTQDYGDAAFTVTTQRLNLITTELQEGVMKTRMQPIENVWNKFPRIVRDLSMACGKHARLDMEGRNTEVDKTLLEAIKDPLTHLIRNAIDHGLELPDVRRSHGKQAEGVVRLSAYHEGGQVIIEIADDGSGIDANVIRRKAVQKGVLTADEAATRTDRDIINVIFAPGFSTAEKVSNISGRGVGMDVVKTNIEAIGGSVDVQTTVGKGTTFKVKIPLTLAIIPALLVRAGSGRYAIPQVSLLELVRLDGDQVAAGIEHVQGVPVYRLRGRLLPLVFLNEVFKTTPIGDDAVNIVVVQADDCTFGLVVDEISDTAEIVVKPLGRLLKNASGFAGATIMGDGRVALILDLLGVAALAGVSTAAAARGGSGAGGNGGSSGQESILVVGIGDRRFALPLALVARLEEFQQGMVRWAGDHRVVHYRDHILPLVSVADRLGIASATEPDAPLQVLVCGTEEASIGLIVDSIHDIFDETLEFSDRTTTFGVRGTTVLHGEVTDVLDLTVLVGDDVILPVEVAA
jgi:two-component system chemotaxis sensor kinase CheA